MAKIKAIETRYKGYLFRSRLEARWAVFFDAVGIKWQYEPEGFETSAGWYLPDFYLPELNMWVEVKGVMSEEDEKKIDAFRNDTGQMTLVLKEIPPETNDDFLQWVYDEYPNWEAFSVGWDFPYLPCVCPACGKAGIEFDGRGWRVCGHYKGYDKGYSYDDPIILDGYRKARSARFEHGECD